MMIEYTLNDYMTNLPVPIMKNEAEHDLGIQLTSDSKFSRQCSAGASKANNQLGLLKRTFLSRHKFKLWKKQYLTVRMLNLPYKHGAPFMKKILTC